MIYALSGCASQPPLPSAQPRPIERLKRVACEGATERLTDVNGDGWADLRHVFEGEREVCSELDLNFDRRIDATRVFDEQAQLALEQVDLDFDGRIDQQAFYENGKTVRKELDTNFDRMTDTWLWCEGPYLGRLERDRAKQGQVDTWEDYRDGLLIGARYDDNHDGKPERWEVYDAGRLVEVREDNDLDGKPDRSKPVEEEGGKVSRAMRCDSGWEEPASERAHAATGTGAAQPSDSATQQEHPQ